MDQELKNQNPLTSAWNRDKLTVIFCDPDPIRNF